MCYFTEGIYNTHNYFFQIIVVPVSVFVQTMKDAVFSMDALLVVIPLLVTGMIGGGHRSISA